MNNFLNNIFKKTNYKIEINIFMFLTLNIFLYGIFINFFEFVTKLSNFTIYVIPLLILGILNLFIINRIKLKSNFEKCDIIFFIILFSLLFTTIMFPDRNFDTLNYHIYLQENTFNDKINSDFFPGRNINSFSYFLGDTVNHIFRELLGYRLGVIIQYLIIITLYYQIKKIFKSIFKNINNNLNSYLIVLFSILTVFSTSIIDMIDNYYVDNFATVFILELIYITLFYKDIKHNYKFIYASILTGISIALKATNVLLLIPILIYFIYDNRKEIFKLKNIIKIFIFTILPTLPYILYNYISTGNPIFPYMNKIFHSEYFNLYNWKDIKFGPNTIFETFIWPIKMFFVPLRANDCGIFELMWGMGYIIIIVVILSCIIKKITKKKINITNLSMYVLTFFLYLIWANQILGYPRYGIIVLIMASICFFTVFNLTIINKKYILNGILILFLTVNTSLIISDMFLLNKDWINNNVLNNNKSTYIEESKLLFNDKSNYNIKLDGIWGILQYNSAYATLLNNDIPKISLNAGASNEKTKQILDKHLSNNKKIYTIADTYFFNNIFKSLNTIGYKIKSIPYTLKPDFVNAKTYVYIFEIEKKDKNESNNFFEIANKENNKYSFDIPKEKQNLQLSFFVMKNHSYRQYKSNDFEIKLVAKNIANEEVINKNYTISSQGEAKFIQEDINNQNIKEIFIEVLVDNNGTKNAIDIINPVIKGE